MKKLFAILLFSFLSLTATRSQTVDGILDKYFENIGGIEKCKAIKTMKMTGQIPTPQGEFTFEMSRKAPNKTIVTVDVMGQKIVPQAFDGTVAWMINPFTGNSDAQIMPEEQAKSMKLDAILEDPLSIIPSRDTKSRMKARVMWKERCISSRWSGTKARPMKHFLPHISTATAICRLCKSRKSTMSKREIRKLKSI
jgi:hypothetical protein